MKFLEDTEEAAMGKRKGLKEDEDGRVKEENEGKSDRPRGWTNGINVEYSVAKEESNGAALSRLCRGKTFKGRVSNLSNVE